MKLWRSWRTSLSNIGLILAWFEAIVYALFMGTVSEDLRDALERSGETRYAVSKATGIAQSVLSRFVHGHPLRGDNTDILAAYLGLELRPIRRTRKKAE